MGAHLLYVPMQHSIEIYKLCNCPLIKVNIEFFKTKWIVAREHIYLSSILVEKKTMFLVRFWFIHNKYVQKKKNGIFEFSSSVIFFWEVTSNLCTIMLTEVDVPSLVTYLYQHLYLNVAPRTKTSHSGLTPPRWWEEEALVLEAGKLEGDVGMRVWS